MAWIGNYHPCDKKDMNFFYAATTITIGDGNIASFWHAPWLEGRKPKDIAPSILAISKRKNSTVSKVIHQDFWISKINTNEGINTKHLTDFVDCTRVSEVQLIEGIADDILEIHHLGYLHGGGL
jgi:hypothetical protein